MDYTRLNVLKNSLPLSHGVIMCIFNYIFLSSFVCISSGNSVELIKIFNLTFLEVHEIECEAEQV